MNSNLKLTICLTGLLLLSFSVNDSLGQVTHSFTEPIEQREVAATQADVVGRLLVKEGSAVKTGDIIAELDNNVLKQGLKIAELRANSNSEIQAAEAAFNVKRRKFEKLRPMLDQGHANPAEVETAQAEFQESGATLQLAKEKKQEYKLEVERIRAEIERRVIRSPINGVITEIHCFPGEFIASNERQLATVVRLDQLNARFYLLSQTTSRLSEGQSVKVLLGDSQKPVDAKVSFVSPVTDPDSGTSRVDVVIENKNKKLRSGTVCIWDGIKGTHATASNTTGKVQ